MAADNGPNTLFGTTGNDTIHGLGGNDIINGLEGFDHLFGDEGNDRFVFTNSSPGVDEVDGGADTDTIDVSGTTNGIRTAVDLVTGYFMMVYRYGGSVGPALVRNVENFTGGAGDDRVVASADANVIIGGGNTGGGSQTLTSPDRGDAVSYEHSTAGVSVNLFTGAISGGYAHGDTLTGIEHVIGSAHADTLFAQHATGGGGADTFLYGGTTIEDFKPGEGDRIDFRSIQAVLPGTPGVYGIADVSWTYEAVDGGYALKIMGPPAVGGSLETMVGGLGAPANAATEAAAFNEDMFIFAGPLAGDIGGGAGVDNLQGTAGNDVVVAMGGADVIAGNGGRDRMYGGEGDDLFTFIGAYSDSGETVDGGKGSDRLDFSAVNYSGLATAQYPTVNGGIHVDLAAHSFGSSIVLTGPGGDAWWATISKVYSVENVTGSSGADTILGDDKANNINAGQGADYVDGRGGGDVLYGGLGADTLIGGSGNDTYIVDDLVDTLQETSTNPAEIDWVFASLSYTLGANIENMQLTSSSPINGTGNGLANAIYGNQAANALSGLGGNDTLSGDGGADTLNGGAGSDHMSGGLGNDIYYFDSAGDVAAEAANGGTDLVRTLVSISALAENVENVQLNGTGNFLIVGNALGNTMNGNSGINQLRGMAGNDFLFGFDGNDVIIGGAGKDQMAGGNGGDAFHFDALADMGNTAATRDVITDFAVGVDDLDFNTMDANSLAAGNQDFLWRGTAAFSGAGQLRYIQSGGNTIVQGNLDGNLATVEFEVQLNGLKALGPGDIVV